MILAAHGPRDLYEYADVYARNNVPNSGRCLLEEAPPETDRDIKAQIRADACVGWLSNNRTFAKRTSLYTCYIAASSAALECPTFLLKAMTVMDTDEDLALDYMLDGIDELMRADDWPTLDLVLQMIDCAKMKLSMSLLLLSQLPNDNKLLPSRANFLRDVISHIKAMGRDEQRLLVGLI